MTQKNQRHQTHQAEEIKSLCERTGFSLEEVAKRANVNLTTLGKIARGYQTGSDLFMNAVRSVGGAEKFKLKEEAPGEHRVKHSENLRTIPVVSWARAGLMQEYEELPSEWMDRVATDLKDPQAFAVEVDGDSMSPRFSAGEYVVLAPNYEVRHQDIVVVKLKDEGVYLKIYNRESKNKAVFSSYNPAFSPMERHPKDVEWIYPVYQRIERIRK